MGAYVIRRVIYAVVTMLVVSVVAYIIIQLPPGDYLTSYMMRLEMQGGEVTDAEVETLKREYGFDLPPHLRYFKWMANLLRGDLGRSFFYNRPVLELLAERLPLSLLVRGEPYRLWGLIETDRHLFGVEAPGVVYLFGTDDLGRDMFARVLHAGRISLSIGLLGVAFSFVLGLLFGGLSGFYGGAVDLVIQRVVEFLISIPQIPLWMALSAALPANWPPLRVYFGITLILSIVGWTGLARVVRGKLLELREADFVMAARVAGALDGAIIRRHLLPSFMSYLIVSLTLAVPGMILGETALSFLGFGLRPPVVSWGVLLQKAQNLRTVALHPWLLKRCVLLSVNTNRGKQLHSTVQRPCQERAQHRQPIEAAFRLPWKT